MARTLYIGGGSIRASNDEIMRSFVESAGGPSSKFAFVVSASGSNPDATFRNWVEEFARLGVPRENCILVPLYAKHVKDERGFNALNGDEPSLPRLLDGVTGVWFTGGNQYYTVQCFLRPDGTHTRALEILHSIYERGGTIGGSSAGAAIMSDVMIGGGNNCGVISSDVVYGYDTYEAVERETGLGSPLIIAKGLGFLSRAVVDQHFNTRPRFLRSIEACFANREGVRLAYGVSEDTAMVYRNGRIRVLGSGVVYIIDCINAVKTGRGSYEGVVLHAIQKGDSYDEATSQVELAAVESGGTRFSAYSGYVAIIDGLVFDDAMYRGLLLGEDESLSLCTKRNKRYMKGIVVYEAGDKTYAVVLKYFRDDMTEGYRFGHTSFKNVELSVSTSEIRLDTTLPVASQ